MKKKFRASDYIEYNKRYGLFRYKYLHQLLEEIFTYLPFDEKLIKDDINFKYKEYNIYIDKSFGSQAELIGTYKMTLDERIKLHENKLKEYKVEVEQMRLF